MFGLIVMVSVSTTQKSTLPFDRNLQNEMVEGHPV